MDFEPEEESVFSALDSLDQELEFSKYVLVDAGYYMENKPMVMISDNRYESVSEQNIFQRFEDLIVLYYPSDELFNPASLETSTIGEWGDTTLLEPEERIERDWEQFEPDQEIYDKIRESLASDIT